MESRDLINDKIETEFYEWLSSETSHSFAKINIENLGAYQNSSLFGYTYYDGIIHCITTDGREFQIDTNALCKEYSLKYKSNEKNINDEEQLNDLFDYVESILTNVNPELTNSCEPRQLKLLNDVDFFDGDVVHYYFRLHKDFFSDYYQFNNIVYNNHELINDLFDCVDSLAEMLDRDFSYAMLYREFILFRFFCHLIIKLPKLLCQKDILIRRETQEL